MSELNIAFYSRSGSFRIFGLGDVSNSLKEKHFLQGETFSVLEKVSPCSRVLCTFHLLSPNVQLYIYIRYTYVFPFI